VIPPLLDEARVVIFGCALATQTVWQAAKRTSVVLSKCENLSGSYVYFLVDPRNEMVFYVGKGMGDRFAQHLAEWKRGDVVNERKAARIEDIIRDGLEPFALCLHDRLDDEQATNMEGCLIQSVGLHVLTNAVQGRWRGDWDYLKSLCRLLREFLADRPRLRQIFLVEDRYYSREQAKRIYCGMIWRAVNWLAEFEATLKEREKLA
jgi:hypothetical protein